MRIRAFFAVLFCAAVSFFSYQWLTDKAGDSGAPVTTHLMSPPLLWLSEDVFLVGQENVVSLYNVKDESQQKIFEVPGEKPQILFANSCSTKDRLVLNIDDVVDTSTGRHVRSWLAMSWHDPKKPLEVRVERADKWTNRADCSDRDYKSPEFGLDALARHGKTDSAYDRQRDRYFWHASTQDFDLKTFNSPWPLPAWWVKPDLSVDSKTALPAGPWVQEYGFKKLSCFACGCQCYSHFKMHAVNGRLLRWIPRPRTRSRPLFSLRAGAGPPIHLGFGPSC